MSSVQSGRLPPRLMKPQAPRPRKRATRPQGPRPTERVSRETENSRVDRNSESPLSMSSQQELPTNEVPKWFVSYMNNFKREFITDLMKILDESPEEEEKRRRYKKSYFMVKQRLHNLERQLEPQRSVPAVNGDSRSQGRPQGSRRNGHDSQPVYNNQPGLSGSSYSVSKAPSESTPVIPGPPKPAREGLKAEAKGNNMDIIVEENVPEETLKEQPGEALSKTLPTEEEPKPCSLSKKIRCILNKVTPSNFVNLAEQMKTLNIEGEDDENGIINQFFEKAIDEPMYSRTYALLCKQFVLAQPKILHLRSLIISRCESDFDKHKSLDFLKATKLEELKVTTDEATKKLLEEELRRMNEENPKEFLGNILFIGELYNEDLLSNYFLHKIIQHLLLNSNETHLEYLYKLLKISGKNFAFRDDEQSIYYEKLSEVSRKAGLSSRIKFMIEELVDVRSKGWKWRRDDPEDDHLRDIFSFSKVLDLACDGQGREKFLETFYKEIQPQFNLFESANFTRELLNSAIERVKLRNEYLKVFNRDPGNKIVEWIGGEHVFLEIVLRELKLFFGDFEEIFMQIPDVWKCLAVFLGNFVAEWQVDLGPKKVLEVLGELKDKNMRRNFGEDLRRLLKEKLKGGLETWMSKEEVSLVDFIGIEKKTDGEDEDKLVEEINIS